MRKVRTGIIRILLDISDKMPGVEFFLQGQQITTDGNGVANINDIGDNNNDALICQSERTSSSVSEFGHWYLDPDTLTTSWYNRIESMDSRGWNRNRATDLDGHRLVRLMRASPTAEEGRFTCDIPGDIDSTRSLRVLYPSKSFSYIHVL